MSARAVALIDYDNVAGLKNLGRTPNYADIRDSLDVIVTSTESFLRENLNSLSEISLRFYGGWMLTSKNYNMTNRGIMLEKSCQNYPRRHGPVRIKCEIADTLIADRHRIKVRNTLKYEYGLPTIRIAASHSCQEEECVAKLVYEFSRRRKCPLETCRKKARDTFYIKAQKGVDSLLICDLLHISIKHQDIAIAVASSDTDFHPALYMASMYSDYVYLLLKGEPNNDSLEIVPGLLDRIGVGHIGHNLGGME